MNQDFETKLKKLRDIYKQPEDQRLLDATEERIRTLISKSDIKDDPLIVALITNAKKKIRDINILLAYDKELNAPNEEAQRERYGLFRERSIHQFYLERFGVENVEIELESLDNYLDSKLK